MTPRKAKSTAKRNVTAQNSESQPAGARRSERTRTSWATPISVASAATRKLPHPAICRGSAVSVVRCATQRRSEGREPVGRLASPARPVRHLHLGDAPCGAEDQRLDVRMGRSGATQRAGQVSPDGAHVAHRDAAGIADRDRREHPVEPRGEDPEPGLLGGPEASVHHVVVARAQRLQHPRHRLRWVLAVVVDRDHPGAPRGLESPEDRGVLSAVRAELEVAHAGVLRGERLDDRLHPVR